jgi:hypothetical protein
LRNINRHGNKEIINKGEITVKEKIRAEDKGTGGVFWRKREVPV